MRGTEAAQRIAAAVPGLKVLYMSGYTDNAITHHGVIGAGVAFLEKPFLPQTLGRKVREVLDVGDESEKTCGTIRVPARETPPAGALTGVNSVGREA